MGSFQIRIVNHNDEIALFSEGSEKNKKIKKSFQSFAGIFETNERKKGRRQQQEQLIAHTHTSSPLFPHTTRGTQKDTHNK